MDKLSHTTCHCIKRAAINAGRKGGNQPKKIQEEKRTQGRTKNQGEIRLEITVQNRIEMPDPSE